MTEITDSCWCYTMKRQVNVTGTIVEAPIQEQRQAELLKVKDCDVENICPKRRQEGCLIGKLREGKWR